ncbi:tRNA (adenosine(37)-N6)-threonylcarbamoyltransferase complex dimerization subunit type 1 TsaB [Mogibacterium pumilum]|uniref:tRNA N6-adenosine(37)-N6-threonylcarbamoyltransferase complex dimerization subunit TsaB n=1 Tax=Mogibacterium pumilum TaxID=86332 RepID=A0A223AS20_9FIRM|nr:tRNA (adenosine(37)-N6)-threonylcarbamoyltransferase complex dimerization subunit type 1 TsaB [Mogibacterium pumilum]ASS37758.1 tRNA N6-adenosine(37)-N6-threonylcarbamoyltransferase complex dimerization subunit TsaB [Mogibacterium pumilum]
MYILSIETTGKYGSAALIGDDGKLISKSSHEEMSHLKDIMFLADACLKAEGIEPQSIDAVAASIGPGSFTGIRIGVSTARGLAEMLKIPCVAVSSLEGMAALADSHVNEKVRFFVPIINARRGQLYGAIFERNGNGYKAVLSEKQYMIDKFMETLQKLGIKDSEVVFVGDGIDAYESEISEAGAFLLADEEWRYQDAVSVSKLAMQKYERGETVSCDGLLPNYMRKSEAEMRLESGTLSSKIGKLK